MGTLTYTLPTVGLTNFTQDPLVRSAFQSIQSEYNTNIANYLATWKELSNVSSSFINGQTAGTYLFQNGISMVSSTGNCNLSSTLPINADLFLTGYTIKIRVRASICLNSTAPGNDSFTFGLKPVNSVAGSSSGIINMTLGSDICSIAITGLTSSTNLYTQNLSAEAILPAMGIYVPTVTTTGTVATGSVPMCYHIVEVRYI